MVELITAITAAVATGATADQKTLGAQACRTILTALEAQVGKPIALAGAPAPSPLAGLRTDQALDLLIARLSAAADKQGTESTNAETPRVAPLRISLVQPPARRRT